MTGSFVTLAYNGPSAPPGRPARFRHRSADSLSGLRGGGGSKSTPVYMVQIVENVHPGEAESTRRVLPLDFPSRSAAVEHIEMLQAQFAHTGRNEEQDY
jgi:hypothetical protein